MSDLRRPWFTLTKTGAVVPAVFEVLIGLFGLVVQVLNIASGVPVQAITVIILVVALLLIGQGVADLVWWSKDGRRARARQV